MTELEVCLDFACHACRRPVQLIVRCEGAMLALTTKVLATVTRPVPELSATKIDVTFDPDGCGLPTSLATWPRESPNRP